MLAKREIGQKMIDVKIHTIKIIAGKFRAKMLNATVLPHTRPTKAIVRESVFNTIAPMIRGRIFVECFAGYGSMGFEALSRGAESVIFLEKDVQSFGILQKNIALFDKNLGDSTIMARNVDCFAVLGEILQKYNNAIFYFDPPFGKSGEFYKRILEVLELQDLGKNRSDSHGLHKNSHNLDNKILIFEHISTFEMPNFIANLSRQKCKKFGRTSISYYFLA